AYCEGVSSTWARAVATMSKNAAECHRTGGQDWICKGFDKAASNMATAAETTRQRMIQHLLDRGYQLNLETSGAVPGLTAMLRAGERDQETCYQTTKACLARCFNDVSVNCKKCINGQLPVCAKTDLCKRPELLP